MVAESAEMRTALAEIDTIAPFNTSVLITGETGTGKELAARRLHARSRRSHSPFVALNCAAVPESLLEDELFGHVRGAFTGAGEDRAGRFEQADGGTLFLDEIGDMPPSLQAKLLRVLQEREFERLGAARTVRVDVRVVAATSADLEQRIRQGLFRLDLYYRLNVVRIDLPPLRQRPADVPAIADAVLGRFCREAGLPSKTLAAETVATLMAYDWPGNVRQLRNTLERAAAMSGAADTIYPEDLPAEVRRSAVQPPDQPADTTTVCESRPDGVPLDAVLENVERRLLLDALRRTNGNKLQAARSLGIKRTTFAARLKRLQTLDASSPPAART
jgi:DNA-binding NtrC family response regulator